MKLRAVAHKGGACAKCGYSRCVGALEFHHLDPAQKSFAIASKHAHKWETLVAELEKCVLLCANCHREAEDEAARERCPEACERPIAQRRVEERRRQVALMAVASAGGRCARCGYDSCARALEFHHSDPKRKAFTIRNGNTWSWASIEDEIGKCVLLCANCHREAEAAPLCSGAASTCATRTASA